MQGGVNYNGSTLLTGGINVNTTGNIQALNVQITENGERTITPPEGVDGYAPITIDTNVPIPEPVLDTLNVTSNGTYTPPSGVDGYDEITVNVSQDVDIQPLTRTITTNGTTVINASDQNVDGFSPVTITTAVDGYTIKTLANTPLPIASFNDGTSNPLKYLTASIKPVQAGSGDPSPTNVRPITGWTEEVITRTGKNLATESSGNNKVVGSVRKGCTYTFSVHNTGTIGFNLKKNNNTGDFVASSGTASSDETISVTFTADDNYNLFVNGYGSGGATYGDNASNYQLEIGDTPTTYEPYAGTTTTIPFTDSQGNPVEVYGGSVDVVNGIVTPAPYYASYNGEQLTGEWISDRDVYSPNTSPTIGAQVVNIGATGTPFSVQPTSIKSLDGENNVSASTGDVEELKYFADL